jgi:hypothetical protein
MNTEQAPSLFMSAIVTIPRDHSFDQFAEKLSQITQARFTEESTGRYDELPAYEASAGELEFLLLGPESDDEYRLEFTCTTSTPMEILARQGGEFTRLFLHLKALNNRGYLDFSQELADALSALGIPGCRPLIPGD